MKTDVTYQRPEVENSAPDWQKVSDVVDGERAIKEATQTYLPKPNPTDQSTENVTRYEQYIDRAVFFNATGRTLEGLIGIAFRRGPSVDVPAAMDFVKTDIDGAGGGIENQSHRVLKSIMKTGRQGLLADFPVRNAATSRAQQERENIHATITTYDAKDIINWRLDDKQNLSLVVLAESAEEANGFAIETIEQWRELSIGGLLLAPDDVVQHDRYVVRIWRMNDKSEPIIHEEFVPLDANGNEWNTIPFTFAGAIDNNSEIDKAPLLDLACLNIAHYRNSADYEESVFFVGQPTYAFAGLDQQWMEDHWKEGVYIGSRAAIPLPVGGSASILEASANTLAGEAMKAKETQMVAMGARLLTYGEAIKTAEQSRAETAAAHSVLSLAATNMALAYTKALEWVALFTRGAAGAISYAMPVDYTGLNADATLLQAIVAGWQAGAYPTSDKNTALRQLGLIDPEKDDETVADELDAEGGGLDLGE